MIITFEFNSIKYSTDLSKPLDISIPIVHGEDNPNCYWAEPVEFSTIRAGEFVGSVREGGPVNYQKITITPHGNGTHTECYGHIGDNEIYTINNSLKSHHFIAQVISVEPKQTGDDHVVFLKDINHLFIEGVEAIVIRTLPNDASKLQRKYSGQNPPYLEADVCEFLKNKGVKHLIIDLPSIDREVDGGKLSAHKAFWKKGDKIRKDCTITELAFIDSSITDDIYLLNLQITSLETDASPSKPVLFKIAGN